MKDKNLEIDITLTASQEEYLKTIYLLSKQAKDVRLTDIANALNVSKPSVNRAIKTLKEINLVNYETYGNISLTSKGFDASKEILKNNDVLLLLLNSIIGIENDIAKEDAKKIKSVISKESQQEIQKYVEKELGLDHLKCGYNIENDKCRSCQRIIKFQEI